MKLTGGWKTKDNRKMKLIIVMNEIIPPDNFEHRNGFSNHKIIDSLDNSQKEEIENELIYRLEESNNVDTLIVETLAYLKCEKAIPVMHKLLKKENNPLNKIIISSNIYHIVNDVDLIEEAISNFDNLSNKFQKISAFYHLKSFNSNKTNELIIRYVNDPDYLISYNANRCLGFI